jgi:NADH dehydrogenase/NADH:ubiquinone oxidoreductase subunit G
MANKRKATPRILPRINDEVNEEWISDKTRHVVDGLRTQRLDQPYVRSGGRLRPASWSEAFAAIAANMARANPRRVGAIVGDLAAVEEIFALKDLMTRVGVVNLDCCQDGAAFDPSWGRASYLFNSTIAGIESADALLLASSSSARCQHHQEAGAELARRHYADVDRGIPTCSSRCAWALAAATLLSLMLFIAPHFVLRGAH